MSRKFEKNRSVDSRYMSIPIKYCTEVKSRFTNTGYDRIERKKVSFVIKHLKNNGFPKELYNCVDSVHDILMNSFNVHLTDEQYDLFESILDKADRINVAVKEKDKSFVILDFYGNKKALCAWRNNKDCKIGITFLCPCDLKAKKPYILYKEKKIYIGNSNGWVF